MVLILDESSSMDGDSFRSLKAAARSFVDSGEGAPGSEVAVMFFSDEVTCTDFFKVVIKEGISALNRKIGSHNRKGGNTYMNRALAKADELLKNKTNEKYVGILYRRRTSRTWRRTDTVAKNRR